MRGLRFASVLGFEIEAETAEAIHSCCGLLKNISAERIHNELDRLLCGVNAEKLLEEYADVFCVFIPEISESVNFKQYGEKHAFDVWRHICRTVGVAQNDRILRLTMLLHDLGKPRTHVLNSAGESTFPEHAPVGSQIAEAVLRRLRYDKKTITAVSRLVKYHDFEISADKVCVKKLLRLVSPEEYLQLLEIKRADRFALSEKYRDVSQKLARARELLSEILENGECYSLDTLAIGGDALKAAGIKSEAVGKCLDFLLERVIDGTLANEKIALLGALDINKV